MRYEKRMLILSGEGKGVVLIEKSGLGVKFALRTFDFPETAGLNAGVVTPDNVYVRALPATPDPSAVFYIDIQSIDELHFAVFDTKLRLYGAIGKKMWEANLMDLLNKRVHPIAAPTAPPALAPLPPIAEKPKKLPLPDGTGTPQSRLSIYGDDTISESDFYTPFDLSKRMREVDGFLDTPRILDGLAPTITPASESVDTEVAAQAELEQNEINEITDAAEQTEQNDEAGATADVEPSIGQEVETGEDFTVEQSQEPDEKAESVAIEDIPRAEQASVSEKPWEKTARWLNSRSSREMLVREFAVKPIAKKSEIRTIRHASFFEQSGADVEKLFESAPADEEMGKLLPELKWVKVAVGNKFISVGRSGDAVLCYAVQGTYEKVSPLGDKAQWLPKLKTAPTGKGYWLVFQSLSNGEVI